MTEPEAGGNLPPGPLSRSVARLLEARWFLAGLAMFTVALVLATELTPVGGLVVFAGVVALCPSLVRTKVLRSWAGLRPMTSDGLPIIGGEPLLDGLWYATGHGRNGILLAGITGVLVRQLVDRETPALDLQAFVADRF